MMHFTSRLLTAGEKNRAIISCSFIGALRIDAGHNVRRDGYVLLRSCVWRKEGLLSFAKIPQHPLGSIASGRGCRFAPTPPETVGTTKNAECYCGPEALSTFLHPLQLPMYVPGIGAFTPLTCCAKLLQHTLRQHVLGNGGLAGAAFVGIVKRPRKRTSHTFCSVPLSFLFGSLPVSAKVVGDIVKTKRYSGTEPEASVPQ
mmetsp:Transcript_19992/g.38399  ORF Transcript_19992/g.38399 Transcript_19992/m.38399 type:complete len:201 (+) Transcript_19992:423-1025(+)